MWFLRFSGKGWLGWVVLFLSVALGQVLTIVFPRGVRDMIRGGPFAVGFLAGGVAVYCLGVWLHRRDRHVEVDPTSGEQRLVQPIHSIGGVPLQYQAVFYVLLAGLVVYANR